MLVPDLAAVIWLWPFTVQDHIYARLLIYLKYEDGALFPWKRGPIFLLSLYGYFPGRWGSFSMVKRAHFPALFVWLFSSKMGPFFHGKYLILYQSVYQNEELRYIDNIIILQSGQAL